MSVKRSCNQPAPLLRDALHPRNKGYSTLHRVSRLPSVLLGVDRLWIACIGISLSRARSFVTRGLRSWRGTVSLNSKNKSKTEGRAPALRTKKKKACTRKNRVSSAPACTYIPHKLPLVSPAPIPRVWLPQDSSWLFYTLLRSMFQPLWVARRHPWRGRCVCTKVGR